MGVTADPGRLEWWVIRYRRGGELRVLYHARELLPAWLRRYGRGVTVLDVGPFRTRREAWQAVDGLLDTGSDMGTFGRPAEVRETSPGDAIDRAIAGRGAFVDGHDLCRTCGAARPAWAFARPGGPCAWCEGRRFTAAEVEAILARDRQRRPAPVLSDPDPRPREEGGP